MRSTIRNLVEDALSMLRGMELAEAITYYHVTGTTYNPTTGANVETSTTYSSLSAVLAGFSMDEKTEDVVVVTDRKAIIAYNDLPILPTADDWFTDSTGDRWQVKKVLGYPGEPVHKIHVRRL